MHDKGFLTHVKYSWLRLVSRCKCRRTPFDRALRLVNSGLVTCKPNAVGKTHLCTHIEKFLFVAVIILLPRLFLQVYKFLSDRPRQTTVSMLLHWRKMRSRLRNRDCHRKVRWVPTQVQSCPGVGRRREWRLWQILLRRPRLGRELRLNYPNPEPVCRHTSCYICTTWKNLMFRRLFSVKCKRMVVGELVASLFVFVAKTFIH
jgi:hypothetical protein